MARRRPITSAEQIGLQVSALRPFVISEMSILASAASALPLSRVFRVALPAIGLSVALSLAGCAGATARRSSPAVPTDTIETSDQDFPAGAFSESVSAARTCTTACDAPAASDATAESSSHAAHGLSPAMTSLRGCLSSMGAGEVDPIILATYAPNGSLIGATIDIGGITAEHCVASARAALPEHTEQASGLLRCRQRCDAHE